MHFCYLSRGKPLTNNKYVFCTVHFSNLSRKPLTDSKSVHCEDRFQICSFRDTCRKCKLQNALLLFVEGAGPHLTNSKSVNTDFRMDRFAITQIIKEFIKECIGTGTCSSAICLFVFSQICRDKTQKYKMSNIPKEHQGNPCFWAI